MDPEKDLQLRKICAVLQRELQADYVGLVVARPDTPLGLVLLATAEFGPPRIAATFRELGARLESALAVEGAEPIKPTNQYE